MRSGRGYDFASGWWREGSALGDWGKNVTDSVTAGVSMPLLRCRARRIQTKAQGLDTQSLGRAVVVGGCGGAQGNLGLSTEMIESGILFFVIFKWSQPGRRGARLVISLRRDQLSLPMGVPPSPPSSHVGAPPNSQPPTLINDVHDPRLQGAHFLCYHYH